MVIYASVCYGMLLDYSTIALTEFESGIEKSDQSFVVAGVVKAEPES